MVEAILSRYRAELTERVLPFWLRHTLDRTHGGHFNCVDASGVVYDPRKHIWMQGRAVWMFSRLYRTFEARPEYRDAAETIFGFLSRHAREGEPRCWFSVTADGRPAAFQRKPYSAFFVALAYLEYSRISGSDTQRREAIDLFWRIEEWVARPELLGRPALSGGLSYTQLADLYVLAWLAAELDDVHDDPRYRDVIHRCLQRVRVHYNAESRLLMENAAVNHEPFRAYPEGRLVCTGSSLEVSWLFLRLLEKAPDAELEAILLEAIFGALEFGWDRDFGGLFYFQDIDDRPTPALESNMKLWWPHTEAIHACALAYRRTGDERYLDWWLKLDEYAFRTFSDPVRGEWFGYCDRHGNIATQLKGGPYKGIFHVPRFLLFTLQAFS